MHCCFCLSLQTRSEYSLCRLYTKSGCPRQFDRRPRTAPAAAGGGGSENPAPSSAAALPTGEQTTGQKRKRAPPSDDDTYSSYDDGDDVSTQQRLRLAQRGTGDGLIEDDMADWSEFLDDWMIDTLGRACYE